MKSQNYINVSDGKSAFDTLNSFSAKGMNNEIIPKSKHDPIKIPAEKLKANWKKVILVTILASATAYGISWLYKKYREKEKKK